jgi:putative proteasome-type protease
MTYCCAILLDKGLVFASDSRTNAGVDNLSTYSKLFTFNQPGQCSFAILTAGNLATSQATIAKIKRDIRDESKVNLFNVATMAEAADYIGEISITLAKKTESSISSGNLDASASYIVGGQIGSQGPKICMIYPEGNYISAREQTPYLQIGETKYGKPILDRIITSDISLEKAALCALVSMDSTMRSNATVGPPIEALIYERDQFSMDRKFIFDEDDPYLLELKNAWDKQLKDAFHQLTQFNWQAASEREVGK